jgi:hypothetical protein
VSLGRQDIPAVLGALPSQSEKKLVCSIICELNEGLIAGLDKEPNFSRSSKRPQMYCALRNGGIEDALIVGGSNARKLATATSNLGVNAYRLATGGWKLSKDSVDLLIPDLVETLEGLSADCPVIFLAGIAWQKLPS